jgi:PucR family transcriptional regulator, purine catabolism regulatory protein
VGVGTAREVLALLERRGARLVAGQAGLDRPVIWASSMHARPPAFESLQGEELALLSLVTLRTLHSQDDTLTLARLLQDLAERGVSAIAVAGLLPLSSSPSATHLFSSRAAPLSEQQTGTSERPPTSPARSSGEAAQRQVTPEEIELAESLSLPLLALPAGVPLAEIEREVIEFVARRAAAREEPEADFSRAIYDALMRASLRGDDDRALGQRLASLVGAAVALEDDAGVRWCLLPADGFTHSREALAALLRRPSARAELRQLATGGGGRLAHLRANGLAPGLSRLVVSLDPWLREQEESAGAGTGGPGIYLSLVIPDGHPHAAERAQTHAAVLEQVAPLFALALARRHDLALAERHLRVEALDALLAGAYVDEGQMRARAVQLGHDLAGAHVALVVELEPSEVDWPVSRETGAMARASAQGRQPKRNERVDLPSAKTERRMGAGAGAEIAETLTGGVAGAWVRARGAEVAALLPLDGEEGAVSPASLAARVASLLGRAAGAMSWAAGLGEVARGPAEMRRSYREARDAARLGQLVHGPRQVARAADLGVYRLLLRLRDSGELEAFCHSTLGPLSGEERTGGALLETLEVFFACNGNLSEAARRLHLHRNSLIYRLNRARDLLGQDLEDPEVRLSLQLALKARCVLAL